jgi:antagonist of KipI
VGSTGNFSAVTKNILEASKNKEVFYPDWSVGRGYLLPVNRKRIRVMPGREFTWFDGRSIIDFLSEPYMLSVNSNRMGYHLQGTAITRLVKEELLSTAVTPGTIQVTGSGNMVLLMADCQTTGGYPRIAQVAAVDLPLCGQLKPGDTIYFEEIGRHEAEMLYIEREKELQQTAYGIKHKFQ